ncbi:MAG: HAD-IA family hydrolase, partial [Pseudomonadota bacterium]
LTLVIFDMDGTLIDSQRVILAAMARAYDRFGADAPADEAVRRIIGLSLPEAFARLSPEADAADNARLVELYKASFVDLRRERGGEADAPLFPGARAALDAEATRGRLLSVATGKARRGLDHAVEAHGLHGLFTYPQTADDARSKPHPEMVERCMDLHGVEGGATVMVGDTSFDMEMARAAGARAVGVAWGYHPAEELRAAGADVVIDRFEDLAPAAARLLGEAA